MNHWARLTWFAAFAAVLAGTSLKAVHADPWQGMTSGDADISASIDDGADVFAPGSAIVWTITVNNAGPGDTLAQVFDTFPAGVSGVAWTCTPMGSGICSASGHGNLSDVVYLPAGETLTYVATASVAAVAGSTLSNTVLVGTLNGVVDPDGGNNVATDVDNVDYIEPPTITRFNSAASPGTCLADGIETRTGITQLTVRFSQPMLDPAGDTDPHDVTNPSSYRVVEAGVNGVLESTGCANAPAGDDQLTSISSVEYSTEMFQASLHVDANMKALPSGRYRVLACGSALQGVSGMALDGSSSGNPGADYRSDFRILGTNLLINPNFDHDVGNGWSIDELSFSLDPTDADGISSSGSAIGQSGIHVISQCVNGLEQGVYDFWGRSLNNTGVGGVYVYASSDCSGSSVGGTNLEIAVVPGAWDRFKVSGIRLQQAPPGGWSANVLLAMHAPDGLNSYLDSTSLHREDDNIVFRDGVDITTVCPAL